MDKIKDFVKKNYKVAISFILGMIVCIGIGVSAVATKDVVYDNSKSGLTSTNLQGAIDELNTKATTKINEAKNECPEGKICSDPINVSNANSNIVAAYTYNQTSGASNYCVTGEEDTCQIAKCMNYLNAGSCEAGTIIDYKVNDTETIRFHVMFDEGNTLIMQSQKRVKNVHWASNAYNKNENGPDSGLPQLESATSGWTNVNDQTYTMGTTIFKINAFTGCSSYSSCDTNTYTLAERTAKARMITVQEASVLGCTNNQQSCPIWMYNYLCESTSYGGTVNDNDYCSYYYIKGYWTMSASNSSYSEWYISSSGSILLNSISTPLAADSRAVIVINK